MSEQDFELKIRPRPSEMVSIKIPVDTLQSLEEIAKDRDMSVEALLKFYIGQGLRQDIAQKFSNRVLDRTAEVLSRHLDSSEEVNNILQEIRLGTNA